MAAVPLPPEIRRDIPQGASACDSTQRCCNRPSLVAVLPPLLGSPAPPSRTCMCMFASLSHPPTHPPPTRRLSQVTSAVLRLLLALKQQQEEHKQRGSDDEASGNESGAHARLPAGRCWDVHAGLATPRQSPCTHTW